MKKSFKLFTVTALTVLALGAYAKGGTLVYCSEGSPAGFDPDQYTSGTDFNASANNVFNGLVEFERGGTKVVPALAESWEVADDGLSITFHLRKGVKFHTTRFFKPTRDFNADDVIFSFDRKANPNNALNKAYTVTVPYYKDMALDKTIKAVKKIDDYTVKFELAQPDASLLQTLAMPIGVIYSAEYANALIKEGKANMINQAPVGTGPFIFQRYQKDASIRYTANKDYWNKKEMPLVDNLIFAITKDASVRAQKLKAGECQIMSYPLPADVASLKQDANLKVPSMPGFNVGSIYYNTQKKPFNDYRVRLALDMAMDKAAIVKAVYGDQGTLAPNPMPPGQWSFNKSITVRQQDLKKAKELLAQAGYPNGFETTFWAMPVQRPYNPNGRLMAEMIQSDWAKIGVKAKIATYEWAEYLKRAQRGEHDIVTSGWTGDNGDPDNWLGVLFGCNSIGGSNYARWCYKPFQDLLDKAKRLSDVKERTALYEKAQVIYHEQMPASPIGTSVVSFPMSKKVVGYKISPLGDVRFVGVELQH